MTPYIEKRVTKLVQLLKHKWRIYNASRSLPRAPEDDAAKDGYDESDVDTFWSANSSELRSISTDDGSAEAELPSFRLTSLIFPTGSLGHSPPASPVKIVKKLPFGYVIGRQPDTPAVPPALARNVKKVAAILHLRSRSQTVKNKVARALKGRFRRVRPRGGAEEADGDGSDEDVFWKRKVRGLRCRPVEEEEDDYHDAPY